jgi:hypothetical protein
MSTMNELTLPAGYSKKIWLRKHSDGRQLWYVAVGMSRWFADHITFEAAGGIFPTPDYANSPWGYVEMDGPITLHGYIRDT